MAASGLKLQMEVVRAATIAVHAAAGLVAGAGNRDAARALRAAEGLTRSALVLLHPSVDRKSGVPAEAAVVPDAPRRRRARGKAKRGPVLAEPKDVKEELDSDLGGVGGGGVVALHGHEAAESLAAPIGLVPPGFCGDVDGYMESGDMLDLVEDLPTAAAVATSAPGAAFTAASTGRGERPRLHCTCGYAQPLPKSLKCKGCSWKWTKFDCAGL